MTGAQSRKNLRMCAIVNRSGKILKFKRTKYNTGRQCVKTRRAIILALCVSS